MIEKIDCSKDGIHSRFILFSFSSSLFSGSALERHLLMMNPLYISLHFLQCSWTMTCMTMYVYRYLVWAISCSGRWDVYFSLFSFLHAQGWEVSYFIIQRSSSLGGWTSSNHLSYPLLHTFTQIVLNEATVKQLPLRTKPRCWVLGCGSTIGQHPICVSNERWGIYVFLLFWKGASMNVLGFPDVSGSSEYLYW